jgi:hypothetical protein
MVKSLALCEGKQEMENFGQTFTAVATQRL